MVNFKRKVNSENDIYGGFDSVIEVEDTQNGDRPFTKSRPFSTTYTDTSPKTHASSYRQKESYVINTPAAVSSNNPKVVNEARQPKLHDIRKPKQERVQTLSASSKTKVLLATYLIAALVLTVVVITTGFLLANANADADARYAELAYQTQVLDEQHIQLRMLHDDTYLRGLASEIGMEATGTMREIELLELVHIMPIEPNTNWFDSFTRFFARMFGRV